MGTLVKIVKVGEDAAVILPPHILEYFRVQLGDTLNLEQTNQGLRLSRPLPTEDDLLAMADKIMEQDHVILRALAQ